jgi:class 3 adenylate cyclase
MFNVMPVLKQYFERLNANPLSIQSKPSKKAEILAGVCLFLCLVLFVQSSKLLYFSNIPSVHMHIINMLVHLSFFSSAFFLSKLAQFKLARYLLILTYVSYLITAIFLWQINLNIQFYFLLGMFACVYFFNPRETKQLWITLCIFCGLFIYFQSQFVFSDQSEDWQLGVINVNTWTLSISCFLMATWIRRQINRSWQQIQMTEQKTRQLLQKMMPSNIAHYLMSAEPLSLQNCITEHPFASIIFIDFTEFTPYSRQTSDRNLVTFLHRIYCVFDAIAEQHQLTKVKTNGDQYIAAVGLDNASLSSYETSQQCCQFALAISREFEIQGGVNIGIKMGIASGNAISGIIGQSRPAFDVWGNTMNLASRLESTAANREIQVCQQTMLYSMQNYQFCSGLAQPLKGLGQVTVYKLLGAK